jgi:hypothetical protein
MAKPSRCNMPFESWRTLRFLHAGQSHTFDLALRFAAGQSFERGEELRVVLDRTMGVKGNPLSGVSKAGAIGVRGLAVHAKESFRWWAE